MAGDFQKKMKKKNRVLIDSKTRLFLIKYLRFDPVEWFNISIHPNLMRNSVAEARKKATRIHTIWNRNWWWHYCHHVSNKKLFALKHKILCFSFVICRLKNEWEKKTREGGAANWIQRKKIERKLTGWEWERSECLQELIIMFLIRIHNSYLRSVLAFYIMGLGNNRA